MLIKYNKLFILKSNKISGVGSQDAANAVYNGPDKHGKSVTK